MAPLILTQFIFNTVISEYTWCVLLIIENQRLQLVNRKSNSNFIHIVSNISIMPDSSKERHQGSGDYIKQQPVRTCLGILVFKLNIDWMCLSMAMIYPYFILFYFGKNYMLFSINYNSYSKNEILTMLIVRTSSKPHVANLNLHIK